MIGSGPASSTSALHLWVLMRLNRGVLSAVLLAGVFLSLVAGTTAGFQPFRTLITEYNALRYIFAAFIGVIVTGVTLVVSLNQLVLSQELGAVEDQQERMEGATEFRTDVEAAIDTDVSPAEPASFLRSILGHVREQAEQLRGDGGGDPRSAPGENIEAYAAEDAEAYAAEDAEAYAAGDAEAYAAGDAEAYAAGDAEACAAGDVEAYADGLLREVDAADERLRGAEFGTFQVVWGAFRFNYSRHIVAARRLKAEHRGALADGTVERLDHLVDVLRLFGPAREHFKTLYFQWELVVLSRSLLYISVPALVTVGFVLMNLGPDAVPGRTLGVDNLVLIASAVYTLALAPFVVFLAYILRIATLAQRTLAIGPFVLRETDRPIDSD